MKGSLILSKLISANPEGLSDRESLNPVASAALQTLRGNSRFELNICGANESSAALCFHRKSMNSVVCIV